MTGAYLFLALSLGAILGFIAGAAMRGAEDNEIVKLVHEFDLENRRLIEENLLAKQEIRKLREAVNPQ